MKEGVLSRILWLLKTTICHMSSSGILRGIDNKKIRVNGQRLAQLHIYSNKDHLQYVALIQKKIV